MKVLNFYYSALHFGFRCNYCASDLRVGIGTRVFHLLFGQNAVIYNTDNHTIPCVFIY